MFELQRSTLNMNPLYFSRSDALSAFRAIFFFSLDEPLREPSHTLLGVVSHPYSTGYLLLGLIDYLISAFEGVVDCYFGFYISW